MIIYDDDDEIWWWWSSYIVVDDDDDEMIGCRCDGITSRLTNTHRIGSHPSTIIITIINIIINIVIIAIIINIAIDMSLKNAWRQHCRFHHSHHLAQHHHLSHHHHHWDKGPIFAQWGNIEFRWGIWYWIEVSECVSLQNSSLVTFLFSLRRVLSLKTNSFWLSSFQLNHSIKFPHLRRESQQV